MKQKILDTGRLDLVSRPDFQYPRSTFDRSHDRKTTFNVGQLIPCLVQECLPGDIWHLSCEVLLRFQPLLSPVMHRANVRIDYFFVPNRILCEDKLWENLISPPKIGALPAPMPTNEDTIIVSGAGVHTTMEAQFFPLGTTIQPGKLSMLPIAAYSRICYDWYYDQNFDSDTESIDDNHEWVPLVPGEFNQWATYGRIRNRNNDRDYFTSALPWPQKGPDVILPLYTSDGAQAQAPVVVNDPTKTATWFPDTGASATPGNVTVTAGGSSQVPTASGATNAYLDPNGSLAVNLTPYLNGNFTGTINDLRTASAVQRWLEADSFGTRYIENIKSQFNTTVQDYRLQRSEYLGTTIEPVYFSEVLQTSATQTGSTPQANMAGHGIAAHRRPYHDHYHCEEHGFIVAICSVLPLTSYANGLDRMWTRRDRLDFAWPMLANTGFQEILNQEIFYHNNPAQDEAVWGYTPRYQEYRTQYNIFLNDFQDDLDFWQMAPRPTSLPFLNESFLQCFPGDSIQIFADEDTIDDTHLIAHFFHSISVERMLPKFGIPKLM